MQKASSLAERLKYVVITPVRDEESNLKFTIASMTAQSIPPAEWIIVDDGSTDATGQIIDDAALRFPWIHACHRPNRGFRQAGGGVVEAFDEGYRALHTSDWDFIVKMDGDLSFEPHYFESCFEEFKRDPNLGIAGGGIYHHEAGQMILERCPVFHVRGATKIYSADCWKAIGGLIRSPGWDTWDEVSAQRLGWSTRTFPELQLLHHRFTGTADGVIRSMRKNGLANYICGYHPLFMLAKCARRIILKPYLFGSVALLQGFLTGYLNRIPRAANADTASYLRRQQIRRLLGLRTMWR